MNFENFKFTTEEIEEGFLVTITGDKDKLRGRLEAFEAFLNFKEKAKNADMGFRNSESPMREFFKSMHDRSKEYGDHPARHRRPCRSYRDNNPAEETAENKTEKE